MEFDPRTQPCIQVLTTGPDRRRETVSLIDAYRRADEIAAVCGSTPGETVAQIEELTAWAYAAGMYPETAEEWQDWVEDRQPLDPVADWLAQHPGCWNLFDPEQPLGQNANLRPHLDEHGVGPAQLILEQVGDYCQLFDLHHLHHPDPIPAAAAYRAMRVQHLFGPGMRAKIPATAMGMPLPLGNLGTCRLGARFRVIAVPADPGSTLGDLLRINLAPYDCEPGTPNLTWTEGRTRRDFTRKGADQARTVDGPADLHTVLGRSVILRPAPMPDGSAGVDRVLAGAGETLKDLPAAYLQDAITFTTPATASKAEVTTFFRPSQTRDLWRESHALYAAVAERTKGVDLYGRIALLRGRRIHLWTVGLLADKSTLITWVADRFPYIPGRDTELRTAAETGSAICEYTAKALYAAAFTAWTIAYPNPKPSDKKFQIPRFNAAPEMWGGAASVFHALMDDVAEGTDPTEALTGFGREIRDMATEALAARLGTLPPSGQGLEARVRAEERFAATLNDRKSPHQLKDPAHA